MSTPWRSAVAGRRRGRRLGRCSPVSDGRSATSRDGRAVINALGTALCCMPLTGGIATCVSWGGHACRALQGTGGESHARHRGGRRANAVSRVGDGLSNRCREVGWSLRLRVHREACCQPSRSPSRIDTRPALESRQGEGAPCTPMGNPYGSRPGNHAVDPLPNRAAGG
jgi:hypothetical protein